MAPMVVLVFILAMVGVSDGAWCVCKQDLPSPTLQKAIDYACGAGANCGPIHQGQPCYEPNTVAAHCSFAANSYYQKNGQNQQACDFSGTAQLVTSDPSTPGCSYPATPSAAGGPGTGTPSTSPTTPGGSTTPGSSTVTPGSPTSGTGFTPNSPTTGTGIGTGGSTGVLGGLGPSGVGLDGSDAGLLPNANMAVLAFSALAAFALL
ncbi:uncharacterized protein A4U43_C03F27380 [Asparagus officinalis]|uniref:X8 domain-containing protein n=1 Tax=Asparagus officinalis TaxID=4686 RepID=A0A5P1FEB4_ASPOF|nr:PLASMODESMATA CALLOSE-BINDING PROTEIN 3-like [Asparagus officinalis]ONK76404.1 uncharacterized protein A4U43_C03F27380 [Asparagus officinalis]